MPAPKHSVVVKTIIWHLKLYKFSNYKHAGLLKTLEPCTTYQTPTNLRTGVVLQRESNINFLYNKVHRFVTYVTLSQLTSKAQTVVHNLAVVHN